MTFNGTSYTVAVPNGASLTIANTTLVNQTATVTTTGTGTFSTKDLSVASGAIFTIPTVSIAGRLSGAGTVAGNVTVAGTGTHSVGGSSTAAGIYTPGIGTQRVTGNLTYTNGSIFAWDLTAGPADTGIINQGTYDKVIANGNVTGVSVFNVVAGSNDFTTAFWNTNRSWNNIFTGTGLFDMANIFTSFGGSNVASDGVVSDQGQFSFTGNTLEWTAAVVPEPSSLLVGILLAAGMCRRSR